MLTERGRVVAIEADRVWVETLRQSSCGSCSARAGCGHGMLNSALPGASRGLVKARLGHGLPPIALHDEVEISVPERGFLQAASLLYALPIAATVGAAMVADRFLVDAAAGQGMADLQVTIAAALGLGLGLLSVRLLTGASGDGAALEPLVTAKA